MHKAILLITIAAVALEAGMFAGYVSPAVASNSIMALFGSLVAVIITAKVE